MWNKIYQKGWCLKVIVSAIMALPTMLCWAQSDSTQAGKFDSTLLPDEIKHTFFSEKISGHYQQMHAVLPETYINQQPYVSLQQLIKGNLPGVYVQEPSGEPGTEQNIFIHGISYPLLSKKELFDNQAAVYLNGIPLTREHPFAYDIQQYDFNRIGPATNPLSIINAANIKSIEVIKDPIALAALGPVAAHGAIWITTKNAHSGDREISVNSYYGMTGKPRITPVNAAYENQFRQPFYNKYGTISDRLKYPTFLRDSTNADYYGPANWTDLYYSNSPLYSVDLSLTGGSERANFRFFAGATKNSGNADATSLNRYTGSFFINVSPLKWMTVSSMITYNRVDRDRNRNIRDRLAEQRYLPDLANPLTPNKKLYSNYLDEFDKVVDKNISNIMEGYVAIRANLKKISYNGKLGFDYNENTRDVFWPTTLLEQNNFVSNYFGYTQRFVVNNSIDYTFDIGINNKLRIEAGQNYQADVYKYDYAYAYNGPNDFIKINVVNGDPNAGDYLDPRGFRVYYFPARMQHNLISFHGNATYSIGDLFKLQGLVRRDGSSYMQPDHRWFTSYAAGASLDLTSKLPAENMFSGLVFTASWAKIGKLLNDDRFNAGPQYRVDLGWNGEPTIGSYAGIPGLSRPYTSGWVGYNIPWPYTNQVNIGVRTGMLKDRIIFSADVYRKEDKDMVMPVPVAAEWGYVGAYKSGLAVVNQGLDVSFKAAILPLERPLSWMFTANANFNKNKISSLPGGIDQLIIGNTKLKVGQPADAFWVFQNEGIYSNDADVPVNPQNNHPLSFQGVPLKAGDPKWKDVNGDFVINDQDKILKGNYLPKVSGGFGSSLSYKNFSLDFQFYYVLGRSIMNQYAAQRLDFINTESNNNIHSVKEITYWEKKMDLSGYTVYNPWSNVVPYRLEQDMFLDNASFLKLRTLSIGYDFAKMLLGKQGNAGAFRRAKVYLTGTNLFTVTAFKGDDPELATYNGMYNGYGLPIPASLIIGIRLDL